MFGNHKNSTPPPINRPCEAARSVTAGAEKYQVPEVLPILPVRGLVLFPRTIIPLLVGRTASLRILDPALPEHRIIGVISQRDDAQEEPQTADLYRVGCVAVVLKVLRQPEGSAFIVVQGLHRFELGAIVRTAPYLGAEIELLDSRQPPQGDNHWEAAIKNLRESSLKLLGLMPDVPEEARNAIGSIAGGEPLADLLATNLAIGVPQKQALLEDLDVPTRVRVVQTHISTQVEIAQIQDKITHDVQTQFSEAQRRAYLQEQIRVIKRELGEGAEDSASQAIQLRRRLEEADPGPEVMAQAQRELKRLDFIPVASPEYSVIASYLETLADLPWNKRSEDNFDFHAAQQILDRDHFGLTTVKRRLMESLVVRKLNPLGHGPILCFMGPPGVGKTSLGQSIADALGRKFARVSLGGVRDEAEIRGHRRTYIGAMPGRIIQELRRAGVNNPVIMLDEVDKIGSDFRGDPSGALLEVLDPRQNHTFIDHYLDVPFDLSKILFIATVNTLDPIPAALRDRLEVIELPGYSEREKHEIALRYLAGRQLHESGLSEEQCIWDEAALNKVIANYTHEAGVRELDRRIASVCRGAAARIVRGDCQKVRVTPEFIDELLGPPIYVREERLRISAPGIATGLAYTPMGGEILHIEATRYPGKGEIKLTGQLGSVMRESVEAALSLLRTRAAGLGIQSQVFRENDIHVHVPCGAVPKDGPSAGVAMFLALASLFTNIPVRSDVAMTGEISLRGLILPVGGLKEKSLAAMRAGIEHVLIPKLNEKNLIEVPEEARERLQFTLVNTIEEAMAGALDQTPEAHSCLW